MRNQCGIHNKSVKGLISRGLRIHVAFVRYGLTCSTSGIGLGASATAGIVSARGRDTGDGQWFINLVDNPLLDHEYTVFGRIDGGQAVAERILEGDRIGRVEVVEGF